MSNELKKYSLINTRICLNFILAGIALTVYLLSSDYLMRIAASIIIVNPWYFAIGIRIDKEWIFSFTTIIGDPKIVDGPSKSISNKAINKVSLLAISEGLLYLSVILLLVDIFSFSFAIVAGIYVISRMLAQVMGFHIYWIARINNDTGLRIHVSDDAILEHSRKAANVNFGYAVGMSIVLLMTLVAYFFAEGFFLMTPAIRTGLILYSVLFFSWIIVFFVVVQTFDTTASLLHMSSQAVFEHEKSDTARRLRYRLYFFKYVFFLFLLIQIMTLLYLKNVLSEIPGF